MAAIRTIIYIEFHNLSISLIYNRTSSLYHAEVFNKHGITLFTTQNNIAATDAIHAAKVFILKL